MPAVSYVAVVERAEPLHGEWATEPYEVAWAHEALFFIIPQSTVAAVIVGRVQISPDGIHWVDEGSFIELRPNDEAAFVRVEAFGGWLRLVGSLPESEGERVLVYLVLKE